MSVTTATPKEVALPLDDAEPELEELLLPLDELAPFDAVKWKPVPPVDPAACPAPEQPAAATRLKDSHARWQVRTSLIEDHLARPERRQSSRSLLQAVAGAAGWDPADIAAPITSEVGGMSPATLLA